MTAERPDPGEEPSADRPRESPPPGDDRERAESPAASQRAEPAPREGARQRLSARITLGAVRVIALIGVLALAVIAAAILVGQDVDGWIVGLAVGIGVQILTIVVLFSRRFAPRD